jgi:DAACS family dicarboxylate/amino acid:cation (Na+ or H+) symporter
LAHIEEAPTPKGKLPLHTKIFIGMAVGLALGIAARLLFPGHPAVTWTVANIAQPMGQVFLRMIFMVVVPLVMAAIALGVADMGDVGKMKRVGGKLIGFTLLFTTLAVMVGVTAVNVFKPGVGLTPDAIIALKANMAGEAVEKAVGHASHAKGFGEAILEFIPKNPFMEAYNAFEGGLMPLMFFALMMGAGMLAAGKEKAAPLKAILESVYAVMIKIIGFAMLIAPFGVAGLIFSVTTTMGMDIMVMLAKFALVVIGALVFQYVVVYLGLVKVLTGRNPIPYVTAQREALLTAFSTSSSAATLPVAMETATGKLKLPKHVSDFVLTVGSSLNHHGTALFEGISILFLVQLFGVELSMGQQATVIVMAILGGIGTAGVPGGSLPMIAVVLSSVGVPGAAIGIIMGIDRILDMSRTTLNVAGDLALATIIAHGEADDAVVEATVEAAPVETTAA